MKLTNFLLTYGWAILIVIIVIALLVSLGTFDVDNRVSDCESRGGIPLYEKKSTYVHNPMPLAGYWITQYEFKGCDIGG